MSEMKRRYLTVPNVLSILRLALIPLMVWLYCVRHDAVWTMAILLLSGLTDVVDGYIARRFNQVTDVGKALDPIADKLTQLAVLLCLVTRFPLMWVPIAVLAVKELVSAVLGLSAIRKTGIVLGAEWHGKLTTVCLYVKLAVHILWTHIPPAVSTALIVLCTASMLASACLYAVRYVTVWRVQKKENTV